MDFATVAQRISTGLGLDTPPVALTFVEQAPAQTEVPAAAVPSACAFWREAEKGVFYASAERHHNCPIGSMVMGFELPEELKSRLGELVGGMCQEQYLLAEEPPHIPVMKQTYAGIVYGPLSRCTTPPDVALIWVTAAQAMLCSEAMGTAAWTAGGPMLTGRPGCAALPMAIAEAHPQLSFGCAGMRTFTQIGDGQLLLAIPGRSLPGFADTLENTLRANTQMLSYYQGERTRFTRNGG
ncbi:DUF169 domain-containing protein [Nonomuraea candida]|uniref:DUF169 domain-containing protein n=1 Tax=Nonomuraea candida TaxID=359159 RepID=UPI0006938D39|nr:DUF169 domain-containing protein [Nonomuraea candida]